MTIAAGVWCSDGLIICADTEINQDNSKYERMKVFAHEDWLLVTGAGWFDYLKMAFDKLRARFQTERPNDSEAARKSVEEIVLEVYERNIGSVFNVGDPQSPSFDMIVGVRCANGELTLIKTSLTAVSLSDNPSVAVGVGWPLFEYWAKYFFATRRSMDVTSYFCMFILREIKQSAYGCGGATCVFKLATDTSKPKSFRQVFSDADILAGFPQTAVNLLLECADGSNLNFSVSLWKQQLDQLSQYFRMVSTQEEHAQTAMEEIGKINKPSKESK